MNKIANRSCEQMLWTNIFLLTLSAMGVESTPHIDIANYALFSLENLFFYYLTFIITWLDSFVEFFLKCFWGTSR